MDNGGSKVAGEEKEDLEPHVTSSNPNWRKLARALRIQRRIEAIKKYVCRGAL